MKNAPIAALAFLLLSPLAAQEPPTDLEPAELERERDRFNLFTVCNGVKVSASLKKREYQYEVGVTETDLREVLEWDVDKAGRLDTESPYVLHVSVDLLSTTIIMALRFYKPLDDPVTGHNAGAVTWRNILVGPYSHSPLSMLAAARDLTDDFLSDYQRVNSEACEEKEISDEP